MSFRQHNVANIGYSNHTYVTRKIDEYFPDGFVHYIYNEYAT